jgi:hypothetical protein
MGLTAAVLWPLFSSLLKLMELQEAMNGQGLTKPMHAESKVSTELMPVNGRLYM